jgi:hypothetical protein
MCAYSVMGTLGPGAKRGREMIDDASMMPRVELHYVTLGLMRPYVLGRPYSTLPTRGLRNLLLRLAIFQIVSSPVARYSLAAIRPLHVLGV